MKPADQFSLRAHLGRRTKRNSSSHFTIGDRVEIVGEIANDLVSKVGVITARGKASHHRKFTVRLSNGTESNYCDSQLQVPPIIFADMIFDTNVSPAPSGVRGLMSSHHMRFICREFDIHIKLTGSAKQKFLHGHFAASGAAPKSSIVTLMLDGQPYATTSTDAFGEFELRRIPSGNAMLEVLVPSHRILAAFDVFPSS